MTPLVRRARRLLRPLRARTRAAGDLATAARRRLRPQPPARLDPARVRALEADSGDLSFITGNGIAAHCRHVLNYGGLTVNEQGEEGWWFCKSDHLEWFFANVAPKEDFVLFSHNGDRTIDRRFARSLRRPNLVAWFAANASLRHPKLHALPLGVANPFWPHGDPDELHRAQDAPPEKKRLFDVSFAVRTNTAERERCLELTGLDPEPPKPFHEYLEGLRSAYFCLAPRGNGIDTHRTWEALYLRTIPVVTRSVLTEQHPELPLLVLDDWAEFRAVEFSPELYARIWGDFDPATLGLDRYLGRIRARIRAAA